MAYIKIVSAKLATPLRPLWATRHFCCKTTISKTFKLFCYFIFLCANRTRKISTSQPSSILDHSVRPVRYQCVPRGVCQKWAFKLSNGRTQSFCRSTKQKHCNKQSGTCEWRGGIFDFCGNCLPDAASDVVSGTTVDWVGECTCKFFVIQGKTALEL